MSKSKTKNNKINGYLLLGIIGISVLITLLFGFNIVSVSLKKGSGSGETVELDSGASMKNDYYTIGNNPTELNKTSFKELTSALKENDPLKITDAVVRSFISEYFTWTNKDGNYEVGGLQYIYGPKFTQFSEESRWGFYSDLDLYISQFGRENLLEVESIETTEVVPAGQFAVGDNKMDAYYVEATWTYKKSNKINVDEFQKTGYFTVAVNDGRYEIVQIFDSYE
ncbi:hypothetical protein [Anaerorhabdus sp.]|uniref:hypothetical protein n=1 Tax=Anaerorhabdus sp. TaxID=1872524 RepID=UPI002FC7D5B7